MCPETSLKASDKPFGAKVLEIDGLPSVNLFSPWRSPWFLLEAVWEIYGPKLEFFTNVRGVVVMRAARGKLGRTKFCGLINPHLN